MKKRSQKNKKLLVFTHNKSQICFLNFELLWLLGFYEKKQKKILVQINRVLKHEFVIVYKVITLTVQGKCTNCTRGVQAYAFHRICIFFHFKSLSAIHPHDIFFIRIGGSKKQRLLMEKHSTCLRCKRTRFKNRCTST